MADRVLLRCLSPVCGRGVWLRAATLPFCHRVVCPRSVDAVSVPGVGDASFWRVAEGTFAFRGCKLLFSNYIKKLALVNYHIKLRK